MDFTDFIVNFSGNYPGLAFFTKVFLLFVAIVTAGLSVWLLLRVELFGTLPREKMTTGAIVMLFLLSGLAASLGWTLNQVGNTFFDYGGSIIEEYQATDSWAVEAGQSNQRMLKDFAVSTMKFVGLMFGAWGIINCILSQLPDSQSSIWWGIVRLIVGAGLFKPIKLADVFGGWGEKYLAEVMTLTNNLTLLT